MSDAPRIARQAERVEAAARQLLRLARRLEDLEEIVEGPADLKALVYQIEALRSETGHELANASQVLLALEYQRSAAAGSESARSDPAGG